MSTLIQIITNTTLKLTVFPILLQDSLVCASELADLEARLEINDCFNEVLSVYTREEKKSSIPRINTQKITFSNVIIHLFWLVGWLCVCVCWKCLDIPQT